MNGTADMTDAATLTRQDRAVFAYVGRTALTVTGGATGRQYRFAAPGALAAVDCRDAPSLRQVTLLRSVVRAE